jgi:hypothetical protein
MPIRRAERVNRTPVRGLLAGRLQLAQPPGMALPQTPLAVPPMLAPELLSLRRIIAAQLPNP